MSHPLSHSCLPCGFLPWLLYNQMFFLTRSTRKMAAAAMATRFISVFNWSFDTSHQPDSHICQPDNIDRKERLLISLSLYLHVLVLVGNRPLEGYTRRLLVGLVWNARLSISRLEHAVQYGHHHFIVIPIHSPTCVCVFVSVCDNWQHILTIVFYLCCLFRDQNFIRGKRKFCVLCVCVCVSDWTVFCVDWLMRRW